MFLKPHSGVIEISWPQRGWRSAYYDRFRNYNKLSVTKLQADAGAVLDMKLYLDFVKSRIGESFTAKQINDLLHSTSNTNYNPYIHPGRLSNVVVNPSLFKEKLYKVLPHQYKTEHHRKLVHSNSILKLHPVSLGS